MKRILIAALLSMSLGSARAQMQVQVQGPNMPPGDNVVGIVTAIANGTLTITPMGGGGPITVKTSDTTRFIKDRHPGKLEDIKQDDTIFARGELKANVMQALVVALVDPSMMQMVQHGGAASGPQFNREDLGKKFIAGEVKAINETKLTIARPDGVSQDIEVDENTSFKKGQESITLPDIKVGDFVRGPGELKENVFTARELRVGRPQMQMSINGPGGPGAAEKKKPDAQPTATPQPPK